MWKAGSSTWNVTPLPFGFLEGINVGGISPKDQVLRHGAMGHEWLQNNNRTISQGARKKGSLSQDDANYPIILNSKTESRTFVSWYHDWGLIWRSNYQNFQHCPFCWHHGRVNWGGFRNVQRRMGWGWAWTGVQAWWCQQLTSHWKYLSCLCPFSGGKNNGGWIFCSEHDFLCAWFI